MKIKWCYLKKYNQIHIVDSFFNMYLFHKSCSNWGALGFKPPNFRLLFYFFFNILLVDLKLMVQETTITVWQIFGFLQESYLNGSVLIIRKSLTLTLVRTNHVKLPAYGILTLTCLIKGIAVNRHPVMNNTTEIPHTLLSLIYSMKLKRKYIAF